MWYMYTREYYSACGKNGTMPFAASWMDPDSVILSELSQTEGETPYDIPHMWDLKRNDTNEVSYKTERDHRFRELTSGCQGEGIVRDFGKVMYTLLDLKWVTNKDPLFSTGNSAQCYMPACRGVETGENGYMDMYG